mmetsp:Transcript_29715/g.86108  ORF Transcript_29715/g.86108 Transcript_29715/m.86108 type:complete len:400 (-) Transcript_29715:79-1278(-)
MASREDVPRAASEKAAAVPEADIKEPATPSFRRAARVRAPPSPHSPSTRPESLLRQLTTCWHCRRTTPKLSFCGHCGNYLFARSSPHQACLSPRTTRAGSPSASSGLLRLVPFDGYHRHHHRRLPLHRCVADHAVDTPSRRRGANKMGIPSDDRVDHPPKRVRFSSGASASAAAGGMVMSPSDSSPSGSSISRSSSSSDLYRRRRGGVSGKRLPGSRLDAARGLEADESEEEEDEEEEEQEDDDDDRVEMEGGKVGRQGCIGAPMPLRRSAADASQPVGAAAAVDDDAALASGGVGVPFADQLVDGHEPVGMEELALPSPNLRLPGEEASPSASADALAGMENETLHEAEEESSDEASRGAVAGPAAGTAAGLGHGGDDSYVDDHGGAGHGQILLESPE